jgi:hypothetical protein
MESTMNKTMQAESKRAYTTPRVEQVKLDTEISLVMTSGPVGDPESIQQGPNSPMPQFVQKIFKLF